MNWVDLFNAFKDSIEIPLNGYCLVTVNPIYREYNGEVIEVSSDSHTLRMDLGGDFADRYIVGVRMDYNGRVTATIEIKGVGDLSFPVTNQEECFYKRVAINPCLSNYDRIEELYRLFDWIFKTYNSLT